MLSFGDSLPKTEAKFKLEVCLKILISDFYINNRLFIHFSVRSSSGRLFSLILAGSSEGNNLKRILIQTSLILISLCIASRVRDSDLWVPLILTHRQCRSNLNVWLQTPHQLWQRESFVSHLFNSSTSKTSEKPDPLRENWKFEVWLLPFISPGLLETYSFVLRKQNIRVTYSPCKRQFSKQLQNVKWLVVPTVTFRRQTESIRPV